MRWRLRAGQWFALAVGLLVVVAIIGMVRNVFVVRSMNRIQAQLTDGLSPTALAAGDLTAAMLDQETAVGGYVLSAEDRFLEPYRGGRRNTDLTLARLAELSAHEGLEQYRDEVDAIAAAARDWQAGYAEPTVAQVESDPARARELVEVEAGKTRFDAFRAAVARLNAQVLPARQRARDELNRDADIVLAWVIFTGTVALLSLLAAGLLLRAKLVRPLQALAARVREVARGDFERPVSAEGAVEVVDLAADVDAMRARIVAELAALREAEADLQRSNAELEQFAYVASHDLQEPLRKVASFCQLLQQRYAGQLDERADQYIGFAVDGAQRMQDLINDLLAFSRVGRIERPHTQVDCEALLVGVRADLAEALEESGARIENGALPTVTGDASLLRLMFQNLCANAIKFRGSDAPVVRVDAARDGPSWLFSVADNGIGIDPEYAERIFVLFQRLHPRTSYEGTGIGLAMCRKIVEYHGGRMWLDTDRVAEHGSTFCFTLPAEPEAR